MLKLSRNIIIIIIRNIKIIMSKLLRKFKIIANVKIIMKCAKCQNYHGNKHKFIYIKLNILNSNTSEVIKLQFIELYISYFLFECNIPSDADHLLSIIILNFLPPIIPF